MSYIKQQNRSRAIVAVQKWGVRQSYATSALNVAEIIKNNIKKESQVLAEANTWWRVMYEKLDQNVDKKIEKTMSSTAKRLQDTLQACLRHKEAPTKTPAAKVKNITGKSISFQAAKPSMDDMIVDNDDKEEEIERKKKAEQLRKENKMAKNKRKSEGRRLRASEGKKKQTEETRRIVDLTESVGSAQGAAAADIKAATTKEKAKKEKTEKAAIIASKAAAMLAEATAANDTAQAVVNRLTSASPTNTSSS